MKNYLLAGLLSITLMTGCRSDKQLTDYVNPFLGTATLWETQDLGYERHWTVRTWGGLRSFPVPPFRMQWFS